MQSNYNLPTNDGFNDSFEAFQKTKLFERLEKKFAPLPYYLKFKVLRMIAFISSYAFNIFSGLTASTLVFFFLSQLINVYLAGAATLTFLGLIEFSKRSIASEFIKSILQFRKFSFGLFGVLIALASLSLTFSFYGSQKAVVSFTAPPELVNVDSLKFSYQNQIGLLTSQIKEARETRYRGTTTSASQKTIARLTNQISAIQGQMILMENKAIAKNENIAISHLNSTEFNAYHFALFTLFLEFMFLLCTWYLEYYDYRSLAEFSSAAITKNDNYKSKPSTKKLARATNIVKLKPEISLNGNPEKDNMNSNVVELAMKKIRNKITTAKYRLRNGIGRAETSRANLNIAMQELSNLEQSANMVTE